MNLIPMGLKVDSYAFQRYKNYANQSPYEVGERLQNWVSPECRNSTIGKPMLWIRPCGNGGGFGYV